MNTSAIMLGDNVHCTYYTIKCSELQCNVNNQCAQCNDITINLATLA